jgi:hypothetical protein
MHDKQFSQSALQRDSFSGFRFQAGLRVLYGVNLRRKIVVMGVKR